MRTTAHDVRLSNRFEILRQVYRSPQVSRYDIVADTGLSFATVSNTIGELLDLGLLVDAGFAASVGGRPRALVSVNAARGHLIGVDVMETYIHAEVFNLKLETLALVEHELHPEENTPDDVIGHVVATVEHAMEQLQLGRSDVLGVGVSLPGQVQREGGVSVFAPNWNWHDVQVGAELAERLAMPLYLDNVLKVATLAELWFGAGVDLDDIAVLFLTTGVGAGLAIDGLIYRGANNSAGEWGHTTLVLDGRLCRCGRRGCVEAYVGGFGITQTLRDLAPASPLLHFHDQRSTLEQLAIAANEDDAVAKKVLAETAHYLGAAVADLVNLLNPQAVILGGWVAELLGVHLLPELRAVVLNQALHQPASVVRIQLCELGHSQVSLGAATLALEGFLTTVDAVNSQRDPLVDQRRARPTKSDPRLKSELTRPSSPSSKLMGQGARI